MTTWTVPATVVRTVDGDTLILDLDLGWGVHMPQARCRLLRVNCPEISTPEGVTAAQFTHSACPDGLAVTFVSKRLDNYGRPLGELVFRNGATLSDRLLAAGHAVPM